MYRSRVALGLGLAGLAALAATSARAARRPSGTTEPRPMTMMDAHERATIDAVLAGAFVPWTWAPVPCGRVTLHVSTDVLALTTMGETPVRIGTTPELAQRLADHFCCVQPTPRMVDAIWQAASVRLLPHPQWTPGADISLPVFELAHSAAIDRELAGRPGLAATMGKTWALCARLWQLWTLNQHRVTYGWPFPTQQTQTYPSATRGSDGKPLGGWVIQPAPPAPLSEGHNDAHHDYSQTWRAVRRDCLLDGREADLADVLTGSDAAEVSLDGALPDWRMPGIDCAPLSTFATG